MSDSPGRMKSNTRRRSGDGSGGSAAVEACLAALDASWQPAVRELRDAIRACDPSIEEHLKWNAPSYRYGGDDRVTFRFPPKGGAQLVFHRGAKVKDAAGFRFDDPTGRIRWAAADRGAVVFASPGDMQSSATAVAALALAWMRTCAEAERGEGAPGGG